MAGYNAQIGRQNRLTFVPAFSPFFWLMIFSNVSIGAQTLKASLGHHNPFLQLIITLR